MKITSMKVFNYAKKSNPCFGAKFSDDLEYKYKKLGYETFFKYGINSKEYKNYESYIKGLKRLCPDGTLNINKDKNGGYSIYLQSPYTKSEQVYNASYKYQLVDLEGLKQTVLNLTAINKGIHRGLDFSGTRKDTIEYIQHDIAPYVDRLFTK